MQSKEEIVKRLQEKLPFLRGKLNALPPGSQQFSKINTIYNIIENPQNYRLNTLEKCEKAVLLILHRRKRPSLDDQKESEPYPPPVGLVESTLVQHEYKETFASPKGDTIKPPDVYIIKSKDEVDAPNEERYESNRPSIYSVVAETIRSKVDPVISIIPSMMPTIDTRKSPISVADLQALLQTVDEPGENGSTPIRDEQEAASISLVHKSKVTLVSTPFYKKSRKVVESAEGINHESKNSVDKIREFNKNKVKHADETKVVDKDKVKDVDKDKAKDALKYKVKDAHKDNIKDADKNKAKDTHKDRIKDKTKDKVKEGKNKTDGDRYSKDKDNKDKLKSKSSSDIIKDKVKTSEKSDKLRAKKEHSSDSKSSPRLVESDSVPSSLDEFIGDKEKDKTKVRRSRKDGEKIDSSACGSDPKTSKDSDKTDKEREKEAHMSNIETKLSYLNKQMSSELRKHGLSDRERKGIRKSYMVKINKYKETLKQIRSGKLSTNEQQRKSEEKKTRPKGKDLEKKKSSKSSKPATVTNEDKDKYTAVVIDKERIDTAEKVNDKATDAKDEDVFAKCKVATVKPMTMRKKFVDPRNEESCTSVAHNDAGRVLLQPPPLPLGFQGFDPFANESAEINRVRKVSPTFRQGVAGNKCHPRNLLHEVGNGHLRHRGDPRFQNAPFRFMPLLPANQAPPRSSDNFAPQREFFHDYQWRQGMLFHPRQHMHGGHRQLMQCVPRDRNFLETNFRYRVEPPPNDLVGQRARFPNQPGHEFHTFDPIGNNVYDFCKMQAVDFYSPNKPTIAHNYREWGKFKQSEDYVKKEAEEVRRKEADNLKRKDDEELKKKEDEELKRIEELKKAELKKSEEELKKKEEEELKKKDEELKKKEEEEELKKIEEELKKKEEELKKKEEELKKKEEEFKMKEEEELKKNNEQELKKMEEVELKKNEVEELKNKEEELKRKETEDLINKEADELRIKDELKKKKKVIQLIRNKTDESTKKEKEELHLKEVKPANSDKKDRNIIDITDSSCDSNSSNVKEKNSEMSFKTKTASTNDKSEELAQITEDNNDSMNLESILKMLSQAKTNAGNDGTFVPTKTLDMLELFLQNQDIPAKEGTIRLPVKVKNAELPVKDTAVTEETAIEPKLEISVNEAEESTIENVLDNTKDKHISKGKQKVTNDNSQEITSTPDELNNDVNVQEKTTCLLENEQCKTSLFEPLKNTLDFNEIQRKKKLNEIKNNVNVQENTSSIFQNENTTSDSNEIQRNKKFEDVKNDVIVEEKMYSLHEDSLFNVFESLENIEETPKVTEQTDTALIGRRPRRLKYVNYNEVNISSDIEDSRKRKRKVEVKEIKKCLKDISVLTNKEETEVAESDEILPVVDQNNEEIVPEDVKVEEKISEKEKSVPVSNDTVTLTKNKYKQLKKKPLAVSKVSHLKPSEVGDTNLDKIIEGVGNGSIHVEPKVESKLLTGLEKVKKKTKVAAKDNIKKSKSDTLIRHPVDGKSFVSNTDASEDQQGADDVDKIGKKRVRRSELDILYDDTKEVLGDSIKGDIIHLSIKNGSSQASSPGSVRSTTSSVQDNTDTKDVKISPSVNEFKKSTVLRVVLKKLPATQDSVASSSLLNEMGPSPKRQRLSRPFKAVIGSCMESPTTPKFDLPQNVAEHSIQATSVKRKVLDELSTNEDQVLTKRPAMDTNKSKPQPNKKYYLKFEKNDLNNCQICDFSGPLITGHYIQEHSDSEVLISRLSPEASQDAFEESVLNDYSRVAVENIVGGGKSFAKFDFRCRFCLHDLRKEHTAVFFDHLCSHTGEARYHCTECSFKHHAKPVVKMHMNFKHRKNQEPRIDDPPKNFDKIFGYICSDCNYLQLRKKSVSEHIEKYHDKETAYVYTINMSLPILQTRQAKVYKAAKVSPEPEKEDAATYDQPIERRLRSSLHLKTSEHQEKEVKCKEKSMDDDSVDSGCVSTATSGTSHSKLLRDVPEVVHKFPPKSALVCDNWDELWNNWQEPQIPASTTPKRRSSIVDKLKKRLDEQNKPIQKEGLFLTPIDNEVVCSLLVPEEQPQTEEGPIEPKTEKESPKKKDTTEDIDSSQEEDISEEKLQMLKDALLRPIKSTLFSIGIIEALIYDDGSVSYVCRKPLCIFNSIDSRVLEAHCTYTHFNSEEELVCNFCPMRKTEPMVEVFAHLRDHVEHYLLSKVAPPGVNIKVEPQQEQMEDIQDLTGEFISPVVKVEVTSPPKMMFRIEKVESLALPTCTSFSTAPVTTVVTEPLPLAPLTFATQFNVQTVSVSAALNSSSSLESTKARLPSPVPTAVTCRVSTLNSTEMKMNRKLPAVVAKWLKAGMSYLLKCPQYQCEFFTASEDMFEEHLKSHKFNDKLIPCLYCNFKMKQEFITIHLMMRHATSNFGCGHCLYRARNTEYVQIHHELSHPGKQFALRQFDQLVNRYRPPPLPLMSSILKPYKCGCGKTCYCTKTYELHKQSCLVQIGSDQVDDHFLYNCRYCVMGATSIVEVLRHSAIEHPFHDIAIICRQPKYFIPRGKEQENLQNLIILDENSFKAEGKDVLKCNNCGRVSKTTDDFLIHIRSCNLNIGVITFTCAICKNNYKNEQGLVAHLRVHGLKNISCGVNEATAVALRKHVKDEHKLINNSGKC